MAHEKEAKPQPEADKDLEESTIRLPSSIWMLLRFVAAQRRSAGSGKPNISVVVLDLIRKLGAELRAEVD